MHSITTASMLWDVILRSHKLIMLHHFDHLHGYSIRAASGCCSVSSLQPECQEL